MLLLLARSKPRPLTLILPLMSMSALRSAILHGPAPGGTPLTMFSLTFGNVASVRVRWPGAVRRRNHADAAFESGQKLTFVGRVMCIRADRPYNPEGH